MKKSYSIVLLAIITLTGCAIKPTIKFDAVPQEPIESLPRELRGLWVTRFSWADPNPDTMAKNITEVMEKMAEMNFNAVFFQVRGQAETLYPSPLEPWSKLVQFKDPGFDPVALAVSEAHRKGLEFHAYINLLPLWNEDTPPLPKEHLYFRHGPGAAAESSWVCFEPPGASMKLNEYYYMNPALPEVRSYMKRVIRDFVERYDIDGIHFDRIRYPGAEYLADPYSKAKFAEDSLSSPISRDEWARRQLTGLVENVVAEALVIKPYLKISAATWGLYRTYDIPGYEHFGSGYARYYQDAIDWLDKGIMDFIVPMIYWDINDPLPNFHDLWLDFKERTPNYRHVYPGLRLRKGWLADGETVSQVNFIRSTGALGHVMFSSRDTQGADGQIVRRILYPQKVKTPEKTKRNNPERVITLDLTHLLGDTVRGKTVRIEPYGRIKATDADGAIGLITPEKTDTLHITTGKSSVSLATSDWRIPFKYVVNSDSTVQRGSPWVELRRSPPDTVSNPFISPLGRAGYPGFTFINGDSVKQYETGVFFDSLRLNEGPNRLRLSVVSGDSATAFYETQVVYQPVDKDKVQPLRYDTNSIEPNVDHTLLSDDRVLLSFVGSGGEKAHAIIDPGNLTIPLARKDFGDRSRYRAELNLNRLKTGERYTVKYYLQSGEDKKRKTLEIQVNAAIEVADPGAFPLVRTMRDNNILSYNLGPIRLGGPIIAEYPEGVVLQADGRVGDYYRIRLSPTMEGFIHSESVEVLPGETPRPFYYLRSLQIAPSDSGDVIRIPYPEPVAYAVYPEPDERRITIVLYGVKTSSTWLTHKAGLSAIEKVTWKQPEPETYEVIVHLKSSKIWGYELVRRNSTLLFRLKPAPELRAEDRTFSVEGLKIAIEAGHGGGSSGAIGLSGLYEKKINLDVASRLRDICIDNGMEILMIREGDESISITSKRDTVETSDADLLVSIHANSGGASRGYLAVGGTSTYYNNPFWAEFAQFVYNRLLELELEEFGVVGSFNYRVTRMASRPAILVEQAFLSHAEDEEKLASAEFRARMAEKIFQGVVDYLKYMKLDEGKSENGLPLPAAKSPVTDVD